MKLSTALRLGRVSNLPTVWTNILSGLALAGLNTTGLNWTTWFYPALAISLVYLAGMYFNDVFDATWDKRHQPQRPIPSGQTTGREVVSFAGVFLLAAMLVLFVGVAREQWLFTLANTSILIALVLLYDWKHKVWSISPWIMGACRMWVYFSAAATLSVYYANWPLFLAAACLAIYIAGITYLAKSEHSNTVQTIWPVLLLVAPFICTLFLAELTGVFIVILAIGVFWLYFSVIQILGKNKNISRGVSFLLAGICLVDASLLAALGYMGFSLIALVAFVVCLFAQKKIAAT